MADKSAKDRVDKARRIRSSDDALKLYRDWAHDYDHDVAGELKFIGGDRIAQLLADHLPERASRIIDLGCGTGLVGQALKTHGFQRIDGLDLSPDMLAMARRKAIYATTIRANMFEPLDLPNNTYDAAISAGTFTTGHVDASALPEIFRILRPAGLLACVIAEAMWETGGFAQALAPHQRHILHRSQEAITSGGAAADGHYLVISVT